MTSMVGTAIGFLAVGSLIGLARVFFGRVAGRRGDFPAGYNAWHSEILPPVPDYQYTQSITPPGMETPTQLLSSSDISAAQAAMRGEAISPWATGLNPYYIPASVSDWLPVPSFSFPYNVTGLQAAWAVEQLQSGRKTVEYFMTHTPDQWGI